MGAARRACGCGLDLEYADPGVTRCYACRQVWAPEKPKSNPDTAMLAALEAGEALIKGQIDCSYRPRRLRVGDRVKILDAKAPTMGNITGKCVSTFFGNGEARYIVQTAMPGWYGYSYELVPRHFDGSDRQIYACHEDGTPIEAP